MIRARLGRAVALTAVVASFGILAGATYQGIATAIERRQYPHPGRLVDVGGHQLHIHCTGAGTPVVVLEAPHAAMSAAWGWVQPSIARDTRVCSYDRAGLGWSESGDRRFDAARVPEELRALLARAVPEGPYVLAGDSLGAAFVAGFAHLHPNETAAVVLIDPPWTDDSQVSGYPDNRLIMRASPWLARAGVLRASRLFSRKAWGLPGASGGAMKAFLNRPDHLTRASEELMQWDAAVRLGAPELRSDVERTGRATARPVVSVVRTSRATEIPLLTDPEQANRVAAAITAAVATVRARATAAP